MDAAGDTYADGDALVPGEYLVPTPTDLSLLVLSGSRPWRVLSSAAGEPVWAGTADGVAVRTVHRVCHPSSVARETFFDDTPQTIAAACQVVWGEARAAWRDAAGVPVRTLSALARQELAGLRISGALDQLARTAYYPGRVEVFRVRAESRVSVYDLGSAYAWAVTQGLPGAYLGQHAGYRPETSVTRCIYSLRISLPRRIAGPLPCRYGDGRVAYPHGEWQGWYAAPDAQIALERGWAVCDRTLEYRVWYPWRTVIDRAWSLRGDAPKGSVRRAALKLLLVSFYGHLAAPRTSRVLLVRPTSLQDGDARVGGGVWAREVPRHPHGHGAAAAYLTALVRARLWAPIEAGAYYCATDAVHVGDGHTLDTSDQLGGWRLEDTWDGGVWIAPGTYQLGPDHAPRRRTAGVPREVAPDLWARGEAEATLARVDLASGSPVRYTLALRLASHDETRSIPDDQGWTHTRDIREIGGVCG